MSTEIGNQHNPDEENKYILTDYYENEPYKIENANENQISSKNYEIFSYDALIKEAENLLNNYPIQDIREHITQIKNIFINRLGEDEANKKNIFLEEGGNESDSLYKNPFSEKFNNIYSDYKNRLAVYYKKNEKKENDNLSERLAIIDRLKSLYNEPSNSSSEMFKIFRELKTRWRNAGRIPSKDAENVYKNYFFHLNNFYKYLDMNKELQELDYAHNLEIRNSIIKRAEELINEPNVQKALNELQYLHRLWKEEAVPVQEDLRESTWQQFKELTNKIHDRKSELNEIIKKEYQENFKKKKSIIDQIKEITENANSKSHREWQKSITEVNSLRESFMSIGRVPKDKNIRIWEDFRETTKEFNHVKNNFYKNLKSEQQANFKKKLALLEIAKEHANSIDWNNSVTVIKNIQNEWKNIGHVPRKNSDKIWKEFKDTCNKFFDRYKNRNEKSNQELNGNYEKKITLIEKFKNITISDDVKITLKELQDLVLEWNNIGKVPSDKIEINNEFNNLYSSILSSLNLSKRELNNYQTEVLVCKIKSQGNNAGSLLDEEIRKTKKNIIDLEKEINQLDNNINFFSNADQNNPLLRDVYRQIEEKQKKLTDEEIKLKTLFNVDLN